MADPSSIHRAGLHSSARDFFLSGHVETPITGKEYMIDVAAPFNYEIIDARCAMGEVATELDAEFFKNGGAISGLNFVDLDPTDNVVTQAVSGTVSIATGDQFSFILDAFTGAPKDFLFTVHCREKQEHP